MPDRFLPFAKAWAAFLVVVLVAFTGSAFDVPPVWANTAIAVLAAVAVYAVPNKAKPGGDA